MQQEPHPVFHETDAPTRGPRRTDFQREVYCIFGLPFDAVSHEDVIASIKDALQTREQFFLTTPNTNNLIASLHDRPFRDSFIRSDLAIADGMPIIWISRLMQVPLRERLAGSTVFEDLRRGAAGPIRLYLFGGPDGAARQAHDRVNADDGPMRSVGFCSPGFVPLDRLSTPEIRRDINDSCADLVVVALGSQKGQAWVERNRGALVAPLIMHLGAVINFTAGTLRRAPMAMQKSGLEWLWRIKEEPTLWRRYFEDGRALVSLLTRHLAPVMRAQRSARAARHKVDPELEVVDEHDSLRRIALRGDWTVARLGPLRTCLANLNTVALDIELDLGSLGRFDSAFLGLLLVLYGHQSKAGRGFRVGSINAGASRLFTVYGAGFLIAEPLAHAVPSTGGGGPDAEIVPSRP